VDFLGEGIWREQGCCLRGGGGSEEGKEGRIDPFLGGCVWWVGCEDVGGCRVLLEV